MEKEDIQRVLSNILKHTPEVKLRAGKKYAHGRTEPGGLIAVAALRDSVRISFITSGKGNDIDVDAFLDWVNKSGILAETDSDGIRFKIREGLRNKEKREVFAEISYDGRNEDEIVADAVKAYRLLLEKVRGSFSPKSEAQSGANEKEEVGSVQLSMTLNFNNGENGEQYGVDYEAQIEDPDLASLLINLLSDPSEENLERAITVMFGNPEFDDVEELGQLYNDVNPRIQKIREKLGWHETTVEFLDLEVDGNSIDLDELTAERLTDDLRLEVLPSEGKCYLLI